MSAAKDGGSSTGFSPHRKQQRGAGSDRVTTRGLVPTMTPDPAAAADASCSPAGAVQRRQQSTEAEVSALGGLARASERFTENERLARPITAVPASTLRDAREIARNSNPAPPTRPHPRLRSMFMHPLPPSPSRMPMHPCKLLYLGWGCVGGDWGTSVWPTTNLLLSWKRSCKTLSPFSTHSLGRGMCMHAGWPHTHCRLRAFASFPGLKVAITA